MLAAEILEILAGDEQHFRIFGGRGRSRIVAAVKDGQLGNRAARAFQRQDLLPAGRGHLEDAHFARGDDEQALAGIALGEQQLAAAEVPGADARRQGVQLAFRQPGKQGNPPQDRFCICAHGQSRLISRAACAGATARFYWRLPVRPTGMRVGAAAAGLVLESAHEQRTGRTTTKQART